MLIKIRIKYLYVLIVCILLVAILIFIIPHSKALETVAENQNKKFIKWVDFNVPYTVLDKALSYDIASNQKDIKISWIEILAYLGTKYGGDFANYKQKDMTELIQKLESGITIESLTSKFKNYDYYYTAYNSVLSGLVGDYEIQISSKENPEIKTWEKKYGLKAFSPIAKGYDYNHYDDFGVSRSYGYRRKHLGNDLMGQVGTPIIAVESGVVEALGWNQYGGWRIGIRSFDSKRYYYYAHLRKNFPYNKDLSVGKIVKAGDVIGYLGRTGYSTKENVNNIQVPHLHFGIQLIFDESQKDGNNEIWIDTYNIIELLHRNKSSVYKNIETKEYFRVYEINDPIIP